MSTWKWSRLLPAKLVGDTTGADIACLLNPRREAEENELVVRNDRFLALGLRPITTHRVAPGEGQKDLADEM
jgi:UDP-sulfoquinovose synthase